MGAVLGELLEGRAQDFLFILLPPGSGPSGLTEQLRTDGRLNEEGAEEMVRPGQGRAMSVRWVPAGARPCAVSGHGGGLKVQ